MEQRQQGQEVTETQTKEAEKLMGVLDEIIARRENQHAFGNAAGKEAFPKPKPPLPMGMEESIPGVIPRPEPPGTD